MDDVQEEVLKRFKKFDTNGDGSLERSELRLALQGINPALFTDDRVDEMLAAADMDGDGRISFDEFMKWIFEDELLVTHTHRTAGGQIVRKFVDSRTRTTFPDGTIIDELGDGIRRQANADGTILITNEAKGTSTTIRPNGISITKNADGSKVQTDKEGRTITTFLDGGRLQIDPDGTRVLTTANQVTTTYHPSGTAVEIFSSAQTDTSGVTVLQLDGSRMMIVSYNTGDIVQFDPCSGIAMELGPDGQNKLQREKDGTILRISQGSSEVLADEIFLKMIEDGSTKLPRQAATAPVVEFSSLATEENVARSKEITASAEVAPAPTTASADVALSVGRPPVAEIGDDNGEAVGDAAVGGSAPKDSNTIIEDYVFESGTRRTKFADGKTIDAKKDGTVIKTFPDGCMEQTNADGTVIITSPEQEIVQIDKDGTRIITQIDGSSATHFTDGIVVEVDSAGVKVQRSPDGARIKTFLDGRKVQCAADGVTIEVLSDGTTRQCNADGSGVIRNAGKVDQTDYAAGQLSATIDGVVIASA